MISSIALNNKSAKLFNHLVPRPVHVRHWELLFSAHFVPCIYNVWLQEHSSCDWQPSITPWQWPELRKHRSWQLNPFDTVVNNNCDITRKGGSLLFLIISPSDKDHLNGVCPRSCLCILHANSIMHQNTLVFYCLKNV